jgi:hypothetical protein
MHKQIIGVLTNYITKFGCDLSSVFTKSVIPISVLCELEILRYTNGNAQERVSVLTPLFRAYAQPAQQVCFLFVSPHLSLKNISHSRARRSRAAVSCARCCHLPYRAPSVTAPRSSPATLAPTPCTPRPVAVCRAPSHAHAEVLLECCRHCRSPSEGCGRC